MGGQQRVQNGRLPGAFESVSTEPLVEIICYIILDGNHEAVTADDRDGVRYAAYLGDYCAAKSPLGKYGILTTDGSQGPPEAIYGRGFNDE